MSPKLVLIYYYSIQFILLINLTRQDYIRSDELILNDNLEIGSEIINLNRLIKQHKTTNSNDKNLIFKFVNDTVLVNYIDLQTLNSDTILIILKKKLNFDDICDPSTHQVEQIAQTQSTTILSCSQTLKIIAVNENDFIEIPIEIRKINFIKKREIALKFSNSIQNLNATMQENWFQIEQPQIITNDQEDINFISDKIQFKLMSLDTEDIQLFKFQINPNFTSKKLNITILFNDEKSLIKSYDLNLVHRLKLDAYFPDTLNDLYEFKNNSTQTIFVRVTELKKLNLKPLDFEYPIYSISIENNYLNLNELILQPKLKDNNSEISFSIFQNDASTSDEFPFYVEESSGAIKLKKPIWDEDEDYLNKNLNKLYLFGIKATYKRLTESKKMTKTNYYYDYMIPAFAKVQISIRREKIESPTIRAEIISPFVSKYEILNEESSNQTFIFYINDPFPSNSKLVSFLSDFSNKKLIDLNYTNLTWTYDNEHNFNYDLANLSNLTLSNQIEFKDQLIYKTKLKLIEYLKSNKHERILSELNVEFRVDYDPLLFEKQEYKVYLTQTDLIDQNLIKLKVKDRLKKKLDQQNNDNVLYRILDSEDSNLFDINSVSGWLTAKKVLGNKNFYEIDIMAINIDLQKSATVKCKIYVDCIKTGRQIETIKFSLFENSPNRTQIGSFRSICSNLAYTHELEQNLTINLCPRTEISNCKSFDLDIRTNKLFSLDVENGYIMTNSFVNLNQIISLVRDDYFSAYEDLSLVNEQNDFKIELKAFIRNNLSLNLKYKIEILIQSAPKLTNFSPDLYFTHTNFTDSNQESIVKCFFKYNFPLSGDLSEVLSRFVRVDQNLVHLEAEFKNAECLAKFFIDNNGCLSLKYDHLYKNGTLRNSLCSSNLNDTNLLILKSGDYNLDFKICYYNLNKVSCSQLYNQNLHITNDLYQTSLIQVVTQPVANKLEVINDGKILNLNNLLKQSKISSYLIVLFCIIGAIALIAILSLLIIFLRYKKRNNNKFKSPSEKILVIQSKNDMDFKKLEIMSDDGSRIRSSSHTPDTQSNAATTSSKISKTDDEHDEEGKIQVMDDFVETTKNFAAASKYGYANNNFSYAGSFSSIGSSYESNVTDNVLKVKTSPREENDQGLYSVKNASIHFNISNPNQLNDLNASAQKEYEIYGSTSSNELNPVKPPSLTSDTNIYNCILNSTNFSNNNSSLTPIQLCQQNNPKTNSLKKIKKEIAYKKAIYNNLIESKMYNNLSADSSASSNSTDNSHFNHNSKILYETSSFSYLNNNNNEILLSPNDVMASIV